MGSDNFHYLQIGPRFPSGNRWKDSWESLRGMWARIRLRRSAVPLLVVTWEDGVFYLEGLIERESQLLDLTTAVRDVSRRANVELEKERKRIGEEIRKVRLRLFDVRLVLEEKGHPVGR